MRISDWSSDVCSSDLQPAGEVASAISGRPLSRQSAGRPEQPVGVRHPDRPQEHRHARLYPGGARGSYRAARQRLSADGSYVGTGTLLASGVDPKVVVSGKKVTGRVYPDGRRSLKKQTNN